LSPRLLRLALIVVEFTSLPLLVVWMVYVITGYSMLTPLQLIPNPRAVHADRLLRITALALSLPHSYFGTLLLIARRVRSGTWRSIYTAVSTSAIVILAVALALLESDFVAP